MHYRIEKIQKLPISLEKAWAFFSSPENLSVITPESMGFVITNGDLLRPMYPGQVITYKVKPLLGINMEWITEITHVNEPYYFVDNQIKGPYKIWYHQHHFKKIPGGTEMRDIIHYVLPLGIIGQIFYPLIVKNSLGRIFDFRERKLIELFGGYKE